MTRKNQPVASQWKKTVLSKWSGILVIWSYFCSKSDFQITTYNPYDYVEREAILGVTISRSPFGLSTWTQCPEFGRTWSENFPSDSSLVRLERLSSRWIKSGSQRSLFSATTSSISISFGGCSSRDQYEVSLQNFYIHYLDRQCHYLYSTKEGI